jgi:hypothetical protein
LKVLLQCAVGLLGGREIPRLEIFPRADGKPGQSVYCFAMKMWHSIAGCSAAALQNLPVRQKYCRTGDPSQVAGIPSGTAEPGSFESKKLLMEIPEVDISAPP